ncbi:MAG: hypothetical protein FWG40_06535 [Peptococcaceae bacterium]|nr:hypothetical protein [Peptococcaceae bacterium]
MPYVDEDTPVFLCVVRRMGMAEGGTSMNEIEKLAILTVRHQLFDEIDIRVSRDIPLKEIIRNLFDALSLDKGSLKGYNAKTEVSNILMGPNDTLRDRGVYDGDILHIL